MPRIAQAEGGGGQSPGTIVSGTRVSRTFVLPNEGPENCQRGKEKRG